MATLKYDRVILTKELNEKFCKVGEIFEVANILDDNTFLLRDAKTKLAIGVISYKELGQYFVHELNYKGWSQWTPLVGFDGQSDVFYRSNKKKVQVKFITDKVRAESSRHKEDEFNLYFGIRLAYLRALNKAYSKKKAMLEEELKEIDREMIDNERTMQKMVNALETNDGEE